MNILLINTNPVVSRLLVLCTRDESVVLHEVTTASEVTHFDYDIVFVDEASYGRDMSDLFSKLDLVKKIFISYHNDEMRDFDVTIKKPFLPSQITDIIHNTLPAQNLPLPTEEVNATDSEDFHIEENSENDGTPTIFPLTSEKTPATAVLDEGEIDKIKALLKMNEETTNNEELLSDEALEARKIELIKEQLIADGLEIVDETEIVEELSISLDGTLEKSSKSKEKKTKSKKNKSKSKKIKFTEENMEHIEDAVEMAIAGMTKKQMKKLLRGKEIEISVKLQDLN